MSPKKAFQGAPAKNGITTISKIAITNPNKRTSAPIDRSQEKKPRQSGA